MQNVAIALFFICLQIREINNRVFFLSYPPTNNPPIFAKLSIYGSKPTTNDNKTETTSNATSRYGVSKNVNVMFKKSLLIFLHLYEKQRGPS